MKNLKDINDELSNVLNSEGSIVALLKEIVTNQLFVRGLIFPEISRESVNVPDDRPYKLYSPTNSFCFINLYLKGRITLYELFALNVSGDYIKSTNNKFDVVHIEDDVAQSIRILSQLHCGQDLYPLMPPDMRMRLSISETEKILSSMKDNEVKERIMGEVDESCLQVITEPDFSDELSVVDIMEDTTDSQFIPYLKSVLDNGKSLYTRINGYVLRLFLQGRLTLREVFLVGTQEPFLLKSHDTLYQIQDENRLKELLTQLKYGEKVYQTLPAEMQVDMPMEIIRTLYLFM